MTKNIAFYEASDQNMPSSPSAGMTFLIRRDAHYATEGLKKNLLSNISKADTFNMMARQKEPSSSPSEYISNVVHRAYREWNRKTLSLLSEHVNYEKYGLSDPKDHFLNIHYYDAKTLETQAIQNAKDIADKAAPNKPHLLVSLDGMINGGEEHSAEIGFSRLFSLCGTTHHGYVGRPGMPALDKQLEQLRTQITDLKKQTGKDVSIVLLEDNVRHAKMLNWVIDLMDQHDIFEHADIAGISTCFLSASKEELEKITYNGQPVPVQDVANYEGWNVDVITPRDFLFDGMVVKVGEEYGRLPLIFMQDLADRSKIKPETVQMFRQEQAKINAEFCDDLHREFGIDVPVSWFDSGTAVTHIEASKPNTTMRNIMNGTPSTCNNRPSSDSKPCPPGPS